MSSDQNSQNMKILENNQNTESKSFHNPINDRENIQKNENDSKLELKIGQYMLTPIQSILLNKSMPKGYKFESEENLLKSIDTMKNQSKKNKLSSKYGDNSRRSKQNKKNINDNLESNHNDNHNNNLKKSLKKNTSQNNNSSKNNNMLNQVSPEIYKIMMKCHQALEKLKSNPNASFFYTVKEPGEMSLATIEKKNSNYEYKNTYDFSMDLRKLWANYFQLHAKNPEIYQKTLKMSELSEQIIKELENVPDEKADDISSIKKRTEKLKREIGEYKDHGNIKETVPAPVKKNNNQNNDNKLMTLEEKNQLGNQIRTLNREQLRGIIKILSDPANDNQQKSKYFEFDIDKLAPKKLRELERYVKSCISGTNKNINNANSTNNNNNNVKKEIKNQNDKPKNLTNNHENINKNINTQNKPPINKNNKSVEDEELKNKNKNKDGVNASSLGESNKKIKQAEINKFNQANDSLSDSDSGSSESSLSS